MSIIRVFFSFRFGMAKTVDFYEARRRKEGVSFQLESIIPGTRFP
jgi:hypothetical protein